MIFERDAARSIDCQVTSAPVARLAHPAHLRALLVPYWADSLCRWGNDASGCQLPWRDVCTPQPPTPSTPTPAATTPPPQKGSGSTQEPLRPPTPCANPARQDKDHFSPSAATLPGVTVIFGATIAMLPPRPLGRGPCCGRRRERRRPHLSFVQQQFRTRDRSTGVQSSGHAHRRRCR